VPVERIDGRWLAQVEVARGQSIEVTVTWSELFGGSSLKLAALTKPVTVAPTATGVDVTFTSSEFDTSSTADLDVDNDGRSNLAERRADTDPRDPTDPGEPVTDVVVPLEINLPEALASADQSVQEAVDITVVVGSMIIDMTRDGSVWRGSALAPQQSDSFVSVEVFESAAKDLRLARYGRSRTSGDGNLIVVNPGDYDVTDDQDNDGVSNIVELANGTDPRSSDLDPCDVSQFQAGCSIDSDNDGLPDWQEGETRDDDGDGVPDYLESSNVDTDSDGFNDENDASNEDPCVPSANNAACEAITDSDGDGFLDAQR